MDKQNIELIKAFYNGETTMEDIEGETPMDELQHELEQEK